MTHFNGFPLAMGDFLLELQFCNTIEHLPQNKIRYKTLISEPLLLLFEDLYPIAQSISETIETKPSRCISGMYQDMRFCRATPLKTYMYLRFREKGDTDVLGLYFDMGMEMYSYGIRIYKQTTAGMAALREKVLQKPKLFSKALANIQNNGAILIGGSFKKDRYPDISDKNLKAFLNRKGFYICFEKPLNENVFSAKLAVEIGEGFLKLKEFYNLLK